MLWLLLAHNTQTLRKRQLTRMSLSAFPHAVAPAGSYLDRGIGKLCPRGTYSTDLNTSPFCVPCAAGITTENEGSTSAANCTLAARGYYINPNDATLAVQCPRDTYQDQEAAVNECTACPHNWRTKDLGSTGVQSRRSCSSRKALKRLPATLMLPPAVEKLSTPPALGTALEHRAF